MRIFEQAYINIEEKRYLALITILIPLINFLSGIVIDMYAPSMPSIALYFHVSAMLVKNTITATVLGYAVGAVFLGILFDTLGRRKIVIISLLIFIASSLFATQCHDIFYLILIRFIQGITAAAMSVGCRVIASDHFTGKRLTVAILYASLGFGIGSVISPFIGGYLQYHFGWQANFYAFTFCGFILLSLSTLYVHERFQREANYKFSYSVTAYKEILQHKTFWSGGIILTLTQLELMFYPTIAPFLVQHQLHHSAITYGNTAFIVGLGYLTGTLTNRILLRFFSQKRLMDIGFLIFASSSFLQLIFAIFFTLNLWCLVLPIVISCYAVGFILGNTSSTCIQLFPKYAGIITSTQLGLMMFFSAVGIFLISSLKITSLWHLFFIYCVFILMQCSVYLSSFRKIFTPNA